jgi:hypothetical protein
MCSRERSSAIPGRSERALGRGWSRWSEPAGSAVRPRVGSVSTDHPRRAFPFPIESRRTERSSINEPRRPRARSNCARRRLRQGPR